MSMTLPHGLPQRPEPRSRTCGLGVKRSLRQSASSRRRSFSFAPSTTALLGVSDLARPTIAEELRGEARSADAVAEHAGKSLSCQPT